MWFLMIVLFLKQSDHYLIKWQTYYDFADYKGKWTNSNHGINFMGFFLEKKA